MKKKKGLIFGIAAAVVVAVVVLCIFCCGGRKDKYCSAVPKDVSLLMRVDVAGFVTEHNIDLDGLKKMVGVDDKLDRVGIDFTQPIYAFVTNKGVTGAVAAVDNADDLKSLVENYGKVMGAKLSEKQGYNWIEMGDVYIAFDDNRMLGLQGAGMNARKQIVQLMEQDEDESVMTTKLYENLLGSKKPLSMISSLKNLPLDEAKVALKAWNVDLNDFDADQLISFDIVKDKAILSYDFIPNSDETKQITDKFASSLKKLEGKYISTIQQNPMMWASFNLPSEAIVSQMKQMVEIARSENLLKPGDDSNRIISDFEKLNGEMNVVIPDGQSGRFVLQSSVSDTKVVSSFIENFLDFCKGSVPVQSMKIADNSYTLAFDGEPYFVGAKGNDLYVSNSNDMTSLVGKTVETGLEDLKDEVCDSYLYATFDVSQLVALAFQSSEARQIATLFMGRLSALDRLTVRMSSATHVDITLSVKDGKDFVETLLK